jgi:hypothetical protein
MKKISSIVPLVFVAMVFSGCNKILDKTNPSAINPDQVWADPQLANAYLNNIYNASMPGMPSGTGNNTDEGVPYGRASNSFFTGTATIDSYDAFGQYTNIRNINTLLVNVEKATFDATSKNQIKGQGLFWRAWCYYLLVKSYGGVPLILTPQTTDDLESLALPRNKTSECVTQIIKDLDAAVALLPDSWTGADVGRIDKGAVLAFKGRVLLFFASPLFNPSNDQSAWQKAYDANSAAKQFLTARGNGLLGSFASIWDQKMNKEVIMGRQYSNPAATYDQAAARPIRYAVNATGDDRPSLELVNAFPMRDGSAWNTATMAYDTLFRNRDDRFYATIYYNGSPNQYLADMVTRNEYFWSYYLNVTDFYGTSGVVGTQNSITPDNTAGQSLSNSSFFRVKGMDKSITKSTVGLASVNWPEIRYAEVLLNLAEAANELGKTSEALDALYQIRKRANILAGPLSNYGITASTSASLRAVIQNERFVEFAFEGKRLDDLRRWKKFSYLNGLPQRHGLAIVLKAGQQEVAAKDDINLVYNRFTYNVVNTDLKDISLQDKYYIYAIPLRVTQRNPKFEQNKDWGGTFDPLQ